MARLEPSACGQKRLSGLLIRPIQSEQWVSVQRRSDDFQVDVNFCPETQAGQEERLIAILGGAPQDPLEGVGLGEARCGFSRSFHFSSEAQVSDFLARALNDVMTVDEFDYRYEASTLVCDAR